MPSAPEGAMRIPIHSEHSDASSSKKHTARPQYRYAIRATAIIVAIIGDIILIGAAALIAAYIRFESISETTPYNYLLVIIPTYLFAALALGCYELNTLRQSMRSIGRTLLALTISAGFAIMTAFALQVGAFYSRIATGLMLVLAAAFLTCGRLVYKVILEHLPSAIDPHVLILGPGSGAMNTSANVESRIPSERPSLADPDSLERIYAQVKHADRIILAFDDVDDQVAWVQFVRLIGVDVELIKPELQDIAVLGLNHWEGTPTLVVARGALTFGKRALKRVFDLTISVPLLVLVGPCLLLLMAVIKLGSPGPAIFAQPRIGRNNCRYQCYKLRTMHEGMSDPSGNRSTARDDNRITSIGKFLRRTSIDELPQLWNVIRGDMSLVGPRPHPLGTLAEGQLLWDAVPEYWTRHAMRPGITGLAQVRGLRGATERRSDIENRVEADLEYINNWSIWLDLKILLQTIRVVIHPNAF
jgi:exopolysaccharide biosynthesis polyprenyl glycosylphosphotransferase